MGKPNQLPALIVTLWSNGEAEELEVAVVKNRFGPSDPMASRWITMDAYPSVSAIHERLEEGLLFRDGTTVPDSEKIDWTQF